MVTVAELCDVPSEQTGGGVAEQRAVREDRWGPGLLSASWRHTVNRQALAVLVLLEEGLALQAQANARACLEQAVLLQRFARAADQE